MLMTPAANSETKLSREFEARLGRLEPGQKVRAVVLLRTNVTPAAGRSRAARGAVAEAVREAAEQALRDVDGILRRFDGRRLAEGPSVLGAIPVETTAAGIRGLAASDWVQAVLEDQPIAALRSKSPNLQVTRS